MEMKIAGQNEIHEMYLQNLEFMPPWIKALVEQIDETELWNKIKVTYNEEGYPVCSFEEDNKSFQITSRQPVREAERWGGKIPVRGAGGIFLFGSGFGYPLFELFEKKQPHTLIVVFEQNLFLFKAMLFFFDFRSMLKSKKLIFLIGEIEDFAKAFDQLFFSIAFANCNSPVFAYTGIANRNWKSEYKKIYQYIFTQLSLYVFYIGNDHLDNLIGLCNLLENCGEIIRNPYLSCLMDTYQGVPAFIIANGPSLDKNINELKKIERKGLIISTESAIIPLLRNEIKPNILTIIERTIYTYLYHFENVPYPEDMALICLGLVDKRVLPSFPGQKIPVFRNTEAINQWVNNHLGDGGAIDAGANVSHLAFELAVFLGADPIIFVGQDYAYGPEGVTHSKDAVYQEEKGKRAREIMKSKPVVYVESNEGTMIPSNQIWKDFRLGLEQKIASHPEKTVINATEGGARIRGAGCDRLSKVIEEYCSKPLDRDVFERIAEEKRNVSQVERTEKLAVFISNIHEYVDFFRNAYQISQNGKLACTEAMNMAKQNEIDRSVLEEAYLKNLGTYQDLIQDDLCRSFSQQIIFAYYYLMNQLGLIDTPEKTVEIFRIQHNFFQNLCDVYQSVAVHLENGAEKLEWILSDLNTESLEENT